MEMQKHGSALMEKGGEVEMREFYEMSVKELCELAHEQQVQIELRIEPTEYGGENTTFTVQPWEKYEPFCPHGMPIVYAKDKEEGR